MSEYSQESFVGGMNLLADDTRIKPNQYRVGFNVRNRFDVLQSIPSSEEDVAVPAGVKQELVTFGDYVIIFVAGRAYYRYYASTGWKQIVGFHMSEVAPRYWTCAVPLATTNYIRIADTSTVDAVEKVDASKAVKLVNNNAVIQGNTSGLLVQDNLNQPMFLYVDPTTGKPVCRKTQNYDAWRFTATEDNREYVPIGNSMAWVDGVLYIVSQDFNWILRSVSGRPLDFVVNIDMNGEKGGDAFTTAYSVGVGGIQCLRPMSNDALFVAAGNSNFSVSKNLAPGAPKIFGEYTFIRTFLFNATCLSDRTIMDSLGDTRFIALFGVRSFNAILQEQNEGRNSPFSLGIQSVLAGIIQSATLSACILYDDYELYALQTIFGPAIAVYDTLNQCWTSFDIAQTGGKRVKQFAKIELSIQRLYAVTEDDKLYTLYISEQSDTPTIRTIAVSAETLKSGGYDIPSIAEHRLKQFHVAVSNIEQDMTISAVPYVNSRLTSQEVMKKDITYTTPAIVSNNVTDLPDVNTQLNHVMFQFLKTGQGYQTFVMFSWTGGATIMGYDFICTDESAINPVKSQGVVK